MSANNLDDFVRLLGRLLTVGWVWTQGHPDEDELDRWVKLGRSATALTRVARDETGVYSEQVTLLRGKREYAVLHYERCIAQSGEWSAWIHPRRYSKATYDLYHPTLRCLSESS